MRLAAERLLPGRLRGTVFVQDEIDSQQACAPICTRGRRLHLYCSPSNVGASGLAKELQQVLSERAKTGLRASPTTLLVSGSMDDIDACEHCLLYLTSATWTSGETSECLADEVRIALRKGVHLVPVHEFPSMVEPDSLRGACAFNEFWNDGWSDRCRARTQAGPAKP